MIHRSNHNTNSFNNRRHLQRDRDPARSVAGLCLSLTALPQAVTLHQHSWSGASPSLPATLQEDGVQQRDQDLAGDSDALRLPLFVSFLLHTAMLQTDV